MAGYLEAGQVITRLRRFFPTMVGYASRYLYRPLPNCCFLPHLSIMLYPRFSWWSIFTLLQCLSNLASYVSATSFESSCNAFATSIKIPNVRVNFVEYIAHGTNITFPDNVCPLAFRRLQRDHQLIPFRIPPATDHTSSSMGATSVAWRCM
jgi:hypothetical protein